MAETKNELFTIPLPGGRVARVPISVLEQYLAPEARSFHTEAAAEEDVTSPTFTLVHEYRGPGANLFHIDLYRIDTQRELETLGLDDLRDGNSILLIEWGEKFPRLQWDVEIAIERAGENARTIRISS